MQAITKPAQGKVLGELRVIPAELGALDIGETVLPVAWRIDQAPSPGKLVEGRCGGGVTPLPRDPVDV